MQQNIDSYFKEKLHQREFDLKADYWQQAEALLDAEDHKKRRGILLWWAGGLLSILAIAAILFFKNGEANSLQSALVPELPIANESNIVSDELPDERLLEEVSTASDVAEKKEEVVVSQKFDAINNENKNTLTNANKNMETAKTTVLQNELTKPLIETANPLTENKHEQLQKMADPSEKSAERTIAPDHVSNLTILVNGDFGENPKLGLKAENGCFGPPPFRFGVTAGQLMQAAPKNGENLITGFHGGLVFQYDLNRKWLLATGIGYSFRDGHFDTSKSTNSRHYRFGLEEMENQMRPTSLHYVSMPISIGWKKGHHVLEGGVWMDYLAGVRGAIGSIERIDPDQPSREFVAREKGWIAEDGFTRFNVSPSIGYRYRVNQEWSFGLAAQYALKNITDQKPDGYILQEDNRFQMRLQAVYLLK